MAEIKADVYGNANGREESVGTTVVIHGYVPPDVEFGEHVFDFMRLLVEVESIREVLCEGFIQKNHPLLPGRERVR